MHRNRTITSSAERKQDKTFSKNLRSYRCFLASAYNGANSHAVLMSLWTGTCSEKAPAKKNKKCRKNKKCNWSSAMSLSINGLDGLLILSVCLSDVGICGIWSYLSGIMPYKWILDARSVIIKSVWTIIHACRLCNEKNKQSQPLLRLFAKHA